jgi:large subunit ribosomal protein L13
MRRQTTWKIKGVEKNWRVIDADGIPLGRLAAEVATVLMGKHRPEYTPFADTGEPVIVINATKIGLSGKKAEQKMAKHWTGYPNGLRMESYGALRERKPEKLVSDAVRRMLPKSRLARVMLSNLNVYPGAEHPHADKKPTELKI